jgi:hypothetical protein
MKMFDVPGEFDTIVFSSDWHLRNEVEPCQIKADKTISIARWSLPYYCLIRLLKAYKARKTFFVCGGDMLDAPELNEPVTPLILAHFFRNRYLGYITGQHDIKETFGKYLLQQALLRHYKLHYDLEETPVRIKLKNGRIVELFGFHHRRKKEDLFNKIEDTLSQVKEDKNNITALVFHQLWDVFDSDFKFEELVEILKKYRSRAICFSGDLHKCRTYSKDGYFLYTTSALYPVTSQDIFNESRNYDLGYVYELGISDNFVEDSFGNVYVKKVTIYNHKVFLVTRDNYREIANYLRHIKDRHVCRFPFVVITDDEILYSPEKIQHLQKIVPLKSRFKVRLLKKNYPAPVQEHQDYTSFIVNESVTNQKDLIKNTILSILKEQNMQEACEFYDEIHNYLTTQVSLEKSSQTKITNQLAVAILSFVSDKLSSAKISSVSGV